MSHGLKPDVDVGGIRPELVLAVAFAIPVFAAHGAACVVTSARDGRHSRGSLHYAGLAIDLRSLDLPPADWEIVRDQLAQALGPQYDVVLERDHFHVEFQPKGPA
ncbi:MAG TPA: hypothetical protein VGA50_04705 [Kiloniellales bacterium]